MKKFHSINLKSQDSDVTTTTEIVKQNIYTPLLVVALIITSFLLGMFITKVQLQSDTKALAATAPTQNVAGAQAGAPAGIPPIVQVDNGHFPIKGTTGAKVQIVAFEDMRCPFCKQFFDNTESQLIKEYVDSGKATFAFRQYEFLGPASLVAGNAIECANDQNKFWEMHDYLYKNQPSETDTSMYTSDNLSQIAGTLGMDATQFKGCMDNKTDDKKMQDDIAAGQKAGVSGTPTFYINGKQLVGAQPLSAIETVVNQELSK